MHVPHPHIGLCIHINLIQNMGLGLNILTIKQFMSFPLNTLRFASLSFIYIYIAICPIFHCESYIFKKENWICKIF